MRSVSLVFFENVFMIHKESSVKSWEVVWSSCMDFLHSLPHKAHKRQEEVCQVYLQTIVTIEFSSSHPETNFGYENLM